VPNFIDIALLSQNASNYAALTLKNLKMAADIVSLPVTVSDYDADILFSCDSSDFTHTLSPVNGFDELFKDYKNYKTELHQKNTVKPFISKINPELFVHNFSNSSVVFVCYDASTDKIEVSENADRVFGFDVKSNFSDSSIDFINKFIYKEDFEKFMVAVSSAKETLKPVICKVKCVSDENLSEYRDYTVSIQCLLNHLGHPSSYQCMLIPE
jgi:hypothetical protein